jgi:hypothetical protein
MFRYQILRACLGISGMKGNEGYWSGGISIITQNFPKSTSILFHPLQSSISQTSPKGGSASEFEKTGFSVEDTSGYKDGLEF